MKDEPQLSAPDATSDEWVATGWRPSFSPKALAVVPLVALLLILYVVRLPYFVIGPGPAEDVEPLIHVTGTTTYPSKGHLLLTAVTEQQANAYDLLAAWIDPAAIVVPESQILAPGQTQEQEFQIALSQMDTSKIDAAIVALTAYANYPKRHRSGALVELTFPGTPADGKIFAGDLIAAIDGQPIEGPDDVGKHIVAAGDGHPLRFTIRGRPGGQTTVTVTPRYDARAKRPIIGVSTVPNFPFPVTIRSGDIGGPSAGLMWALGLIDVLTPGDLTGGRKIAGTGEIGPDGKVYPIGGIQEKVVAAQRAGATIFLSPAANAADARSVAQGITVVSVGTYRDAVTYLTSHP
jgi:PDZ domain-containing protein